MSVIVARTCRQLSEARPAKRAGLILLALAAFSVVGTSAWAFWTTFGSGSASATTGTLSPPTSPVATNTVGSSTVNVSWTASSGPTVPQGYYVTRIKNSDSSATPACASSASSLIAGPSCSDLAVPDETFHYTVTAVYHSWSATSSASNTVTVTSSIATTTTVTSSPNPSVVGQSVTYTATVTPNSGSATPTGTVTFKDNGTTITCTSGTPALNGSGVATCTLASTGVASHPITAAYPADANFLTSTSSAITQVINQASTTTTVTSSLTPTVVGQPVTYTATVTAVSPGAGTPTGTVTFKDGLSTIACTGGSTTLSLGLATCQIAYTGVGTHSITAVYGSDTNFLTSTSSPAITQTVSQASTSTALTSSVNPSVVGQSVTFTATVAVNAPGAGTPTGNVEFFDGGTPIGTCGGVTGSPLSGTTATCSVSYPTVSSHTITAQYLGSTDFNASAASASLTQTVSTSLAIAAVFNDHGKIKVYFTGTGAAADTAITVTICALNSFPCANSISVSTASNPPAGNWTSGTSSKNLDEGTTYYAQAVQGTTSSAVFSFSPPP